MNFPGMKPVSSAGFCMECQYKIVDVIGGVALLGEHAVPAFTVCLKRWFCGKLDGELQEFIRTVGRDPVSKLVAFLQFAQVAESAHEVVEAEERRAQHTGFGRHGLAVADKQGGVCQQVVYVGGMHGDAVRFEGSGEQALGGDQQPSVRGKFAGKLQGQFVVDAPDAMVVVGVEGGQAQDEKAAVRVEIAGGDVQIGCEMVRVQVGELVVAGIEHGFSVPSAIFSAFRAKDGISPWIGQPCVQRDDGGIVLVHVDSWDTQPFACVGNVGGGSDEQVGAVVARVGDQSASAAEKVAHHAGAAGRLALWEDVLIGQPGILQQAGEHILFFGHDVHGVPGVPQPGDGVPEQMEVGGVAQMEQHLFLFPSFNLSYT